MENIYKIPSPYCCVLQQTLHIPLHISGHSNRLSISLFIFLDTPTDSPYLNGTIPTASFEWLYI
uniref:Uncharacterized protein n=1 Tax=Arundo donax TaxID=35708 RepID=A0A0A9BQ96_ARUDO